MGFFEFFDTLDIVDKTLDAFNDWEMSQLAAGLKFAGAVALTVGTSVSNWGVWSTYMCETLAGIRVAFNTWFMFVLYSQTSAQSVDEVAAIIYQAWRISNIETVVALAFDLIVTVFTIAYNYNKVEAWSINTGGLVLDFIGIYFGFYVREFWLDYDPYMTMAEDDLF